MTTVTVLALAAFGSYELVQDGAGGGQGPSAAFVPAGHANAMDVQVIGQQWEFTYRYPSYGGVETPQLVLPANTLIGSTSPRSTSIHSFWAYQLGVKADANPGVDNVAYVKDEGPETSRSAAPSSAGSGTATCSTPAGSCAPARSRPGSSRQQAYFAAGREVPAAVRDSYLPDPQRRAG